MIAPVFNILSVTHTGDTITAVLAVNGDSAVFEGHFPGQPVVPGACMLQLVKDILSDQLRVNIKLLKADNIKFLGLIQPGPDHLDLQIAYQIVEDQLKITAALSVAEITSMKLQATFMIG